MAVPVSEAYSDVGRPNYSGNWRKAGSTPMKVRRVQAFTLVEVILAAGFLILVGTLLVVGITQISAAIRANATWTDGRFLNAPTVVDLSPSRGTFSFALKTGTGIDEYGRPVNYNAGLPVQHGVTVTLWRPTPINGAIISLNGTELSFGATSGTATTGANGLVVIVVEIDDEVSFRLEVTDDVTGDKEHAIFIGHVP